MQSKKSKPPHGGPDTTISSGISEAGGGTGGVEAAINNTVPDFQRMDIGSKKNDPSGTFSFGGL